MDITLISQLLQNSSFLNLELPEAAGLSRIYQYTSSHTPFCVITAWKNDRGYSVSTNRDRNSSLMSDLRSHNLGGIQLQGHYQEQGSPNSSNETAFFVPYLGKDVNDFKKTMASLCGKYNQECVLFSDGKQVGFLSSSGSLSSTFSAVTFNSSKIKEFWSTISGKRFAFIESGFCSNNVATRASWDFVGLIPDLQYTKENLNNIPKLKEQGIVRDCDAHYKERSTSKKLLDLLN